jgi:hypothetical protein
LILDSCIEQFGIRSDLSVNPASLCGQSEHGAALIVCIRCSLDEFGAFQELQDPGQAGRQKKASLGEFAGVDFLVGGQGARDVRCSSADESRELRSS